MDPPKLCGAVSKLSHNTLSQYLRFLRRPRGGPRGGRRGGASQEGCNCGEANTLSNFNRIDGGEKTERNKYPWIVYFRRKGLKDVKYPNGTKRGMGYACAGALLDTNHVLLAAHCINEKEFRRWEYQVQSLSTKRPSLVWNFPHFFWTGSM